jgi:hypothetical protein
LNTNAAAEPVKIEPNKLKGSASPTPIKSKEIDRKGKGVPAR